MAHDVFVSYSKEDKPIVDAVVAGLENSGIRCWVAPRDITPGSSWSQAIVEAIEDSRVMVIIFSANYNRSKQVEREVEKAVATKVIIIPFRIEDIDPTSAMAYFLSREHWLDAITPPLEEHINKLGNKIHFFLTHGEQKVVEERTLQAQDNPALVIRRQQGLTDDQKTVLQAFSRALQRETHVLTSHPGIFWQHLYNRLQWERNEVKSVISPELARRSLPKAKPWLNLQTPHRESSSLTRTLNCPSSVYKCLFSPDGKYIVSSGGGLTQIWDVATGMVIRNLTGYEPAFSPDGYWIATAEEDHGVCLWEVANGVIKHFMKDYSKSINSSTFSPDGNLIASACTDYSVRVWDVHTGNLLQVLDHNYDNVNTCAFSPNKPLIVTGSESGRLKVWNKDTGRVILNWYGGHGHVTDCCFSPDGKLIVSAGYDETVRIWDAETGTELYALDDHRDRVNACAISPDGKLIVTACDDKKIRLYSYTTGELLAEIIGHNHFVEACAFSPDSHWIISGSDDNTVRMWSTQTKHIIPSGEHHDARARACVFSPDGKLIASSGDDLSVRLWDVKTGNAIRTIECHTEPEVVDCAFSPDGRSIVSAGWDGTMRVSNVATGATLHTLEGHQGSGTAMDGRLIVGAVLACDYSPLGDLIVSGGRDKTIRLWNANTGKWLRTFESLMDSDVNAIAFSPDGRVIVAAGGESLRIWDVVSGKVIRDLNLPNLSGSYESCIFSPDGNWVISAKGKILGIWDLATGQVKRVLEEHTDKITSCDVSSDGHLIASASVDGTIKVWDINKWKVIAQILLPGYIHCVGFHPFTPKLVCCDAGGAVYRLNLLGITYGPIIVTSYEQEHEEIRVRCPACHYTFSINQSMLGNELNCEQPECNTRLKVNSLTILDMQRKHGWLSKLLKKN